MSNEIISADWYKALIDDCGAILTETVHNARWDLIVGHHQLGKRILEDYSNFERSEIYGKGIVHAVAESLGVSERFMYYIMEFVRQYPDVNSLPEGKNISWSKICKKLLTAPKAACGHEEHEEITVEICKKCRKEIKED